MEYNIYEDRRLLLVLILDRAGAEKKPLIFN